MAKFKPTRTAPAQGADIEIVERSRDSNLAVIPNVVRINGTEVLIPADSTIDVSEISSETLVTVTLTMFVRSLSIRHESVDTPDP
jgi:hypothetical protein